MRRVWGCGHTDAYNTTYNNRIVAELSAFQFPVVKKRSECCYFDKRQEFEAQIHVLAIAINRWLLDVDLQVVTLVH